MMRKHPYEILLDRKRKWSPVKPTIGPIKDEARATIGRALAARHLELPVGTFIKEGLEKDVPDNARKLLEDNVKDEERHDLALGYYADAFGTNENDEKEGKLLRDAWINHPDHTITKALVAERSIFFVLLPFFRFNGDAALRTISADISRDEQIHVGSNSLVCSELGLRPSNSLDKLRKSTINWIVNPLGINTEDRYLDKKFWLDASDRLMYEGKAPEFSETQRARMPACCEHANTDLPKYA